LSALEWWVLLLSCLLLPAVAVMLKIRGYARTKSFLENLLPAKHPDKKAGNGPADPTVTIPRMVSVAARYGPYRANCLKQALVTWWLLARRGYPAEIRFGVRDSQQVLPDAHAWVDLDGVNVSDNPSLQAQVLQFK